MGICIVFMLLCCVAVLRACSPGCHCQVESFGMFGSFSLTKVDCSGLGPHMTAIPIPLDTSYLDLSSNTLTSVSMAMFRGPGYTTLANLDLSHNGISQLSPDTFSKLRYLEALNLSHNSLETLENGIFSNLPLGEVDLSHNRLRQVNLDAFSSSRGHGKPLTVNLSANHISWLGWNLDRATPNIYTLDLSGNRLDRVPTAWLARVPLRWLSLAGNPITTIGDKAFSGLQELTDLSLSGLTHLTELSRGAFNGLHNLQQLDLSLSPRLRALDAAVFSGLDSLRELNLSGSGVSGLPRGALELLPAIGRIWVGGSALRCGTTAREGSFHRQFGFALYQMQGLLLS
uniref:Tsukushi small leucine rich proteoglycan homolog (Xenopus laevis) n=1 Tax=Callorhinchus milii TaxID=7868 RepID=A0A4W3JF26_CALMI